MGCEIRAYRLIAYLNGLGRRREGNERCIRVR